MNFDTDIQRPCISCGQNESHRDGLCRTCATALVEPELTYAQPLWIGPCAECGLKGSSYVTRSCSRCGGKAAA